MKIFKLIPGEISNGSPGRTLTYTFGGNPENALEPILEKKEYISNKS